MSQNSANRNAAETLRVAKARRQLWDDTRCKSPMHCNECDTDATCQREHVHRPGFHAAGNHKWTDDLVVHI